MSWAERLSCEIWIVVPLVGTAAFSPEGVLSRCYRYFVPIPSAANTLTVFVLIAHPPSHSQRGGGTWDCPVQGQLVAGKCPVAYSQRPMGRRGSCRASAGWIPGSSALAPSRSQCTLACRGTPHGVRPRDLLWRGMFAPAMSELG